MLNGIPVGSPRKSSSAIAVTAPNVIKEEPTSHSSSLSNPGNPLVPPPTPIFATFDTFPPLDSLSAFGLDDDSNDKTSGSGHANANSVDPLSPLGHDPFLSSTSFGFENEMDVGGVFP